MSYRKVPLSFLFGLVCFTFFTACSNSVKEVSTESIQDSKDLEAKASVGGRYSVLLHVLHVPKDREEFGEFRDWGRWNGTEYEGIQNLSPGYWVYVYPYWFVWEKKELTV